MDSELKAKWIEALRSGNYSQSKGCLREEDRGFCCLGVLADLQGAVWHGSIPLIGNKPAATDDDGIFLTPAFAGGLSLSDQNQLADRNDGLKGFANDRHDFARIADYIEANIPADNSLSPAGQDARVVGEPSRSPA